MPREETKNERKSCASLSVCGTIEVPVEGSDKQLYNGMYDNVFTFMLSSLKNKNRQDKHRKCIMRSEEKM